MTTIPVPIVKPIIRSALIVATAIACASSPAPSRPVAPPGRGPLFAFHSNVWVNLHHFLYVTARARSGLDASRAAVTAALADTVGFARLSPQQQDAWNAAIVYYQRAVAPRDILFDTALVTVNNRLAAAEGAQSVRDSGLDSALAAILDRAAPVYRALWWTRHDASNKRWIDSAMVLLAKDGDATARAEARIFHHEWSTTAVRVDVAAYTNWAGAYTSEQPAHVNISSMHPDNGGTYAYETLFHEVLHTMDGSVFSAIQAAFRGAGKRLPRDPTHAFIFYTAGELTRRAFPGHVPYAEQFGLWARVPDYVHILPLIRAHWQPYIDGEISLTESLRPIAAEY